jgi:hypothetical protein
LFEKNFNSLIHAKNDVLNKYGIFQRIAEICEDDFKNDLTHKNRTKQAITLLSRETLKTKNTDLLPKKKKSKFSRLRKKLLKFLPLPQNLWVESGI